MFNRGLLTAVCFLLVVMSGLFPGGCKSPETGTSKKTEGEGLHIITTISVFADLVENVMGENGSVEYLVPVGDNPEDYELLPGQLQIISEADAVFVNGWGLEEKIEQALLNITETRIFYLTGGIDPIPLAGSLGSDPHAWFDPNKTARYVKNIEGFLTELDPAGEPVYNQNAKLYLDRLQKLDTWIREQVERVPEKNRFIIISENALKYFGEAYGFRTEGIWEINAHEEGTPRQIQRIVDIVAKEDIPALFVETTVDSRYMETVSRETGVPIAGTVYTDALGPSGSNADTYLKMMKHNVEEFRKGLALE